MSSENLNRDLFEYKDLESLAIDEFHYALPYEFHIRANKERYKEYLNLFYINKDNELNIKNYTYIVKGLAKEREYLLDLTPDEVLEEVLRHMKDSFFGVGGNNGVANPYYLYVDYHFFTDEEKQIAKLLKDIYTPKVIDEWIPQTHLSIKQDEKSSPIYTENHMSIRIDKRTKINHNKGFPFAGKYDNLNNLQGYNYEQSYEIKYKRPKMFTLGGNKKTIKQEININLPREVILKQLERIIDIAKEDNRNILSDSDKIEMACYIDEPEIINSEIKEFYKKRTIINSLFAYDYFSIREVEVEYENQKIKEKLNQKLKEIKKNFLYDATDREEQIAIAKEENKKKINDDIYNELEKLLYEKNKDLKSDTIKGNISQVKKLLKDENYEKDNHFLNFINGI